MSESSRYDGGEIDPLPTHSHVMHALYQLDDYDTENGIPATVVVEHVVDLTGLSSADVRDSLEFLHLNGEIYEPRPDHLRRTEQNDERWERFEVACRWQESLAEARIPIGRGLKPHELVTRYDVEDPDRIGELVTRATLEVDNSANEKLTLDDLDKAAGRMGISRIVCDGGEPTDDLDAEAHALEDVYNDATADHAPELEWFAMGFDPDTDEESFVLEAGGYLTPDGLGALRDAGREIQYIEGYAIDDQVFVQIQVGVAGEAPDGGQR